MAIVDQFLYGFVQGGLEPGETVMGAGMGRRPTKFSVVGVPQVYVDHLVVATDRRLIVFETETGFSIMTPTAKPVARNPIEWRYDELAVVRTGAVEGAVIHSGGAGTWIALIPHAYCGPLQSEQDPNDLQHGKGRRYDLYAHIDGIDGQRALYAQYPAWLAARVNGGAFPMQPHKRAEVEARVAERRAFLAAEQQRRLQAAALRDAQLKAAWAAFRPYALAAGLALGGLVALLFGALFVSSGVDRWGDGNDGVEHFEARVKFLKRDQAWSQNPALAPPSDCPEEKLPFFIGGRRADERTCHLCVERSQFDSRPFPGGRSFPRGNKVWDCPAPTAYVAALRQARDDLDFQEDEVTSGLVTTIEGLVLVLLGIGGVVVGGVLASRKRRALQAGGAAAGAPMQAAMPGAGPPGSPGAALGAPPRPG